MFPRSGGAWRVLNAGVFALSGGVLLWMGLEATDLGMWFMVLLALGWLVFMFFVSRAERDDEEGSEKKRVELEATDPLGAVGEELENTAHYPNLWRRDP
jgi:hypothetical protein